MTEPHPGLLVKLVRSVALLALPHQSQVTWLESLGLGAPGFADELAMELEDGAMLSQQFEEAGWLSAEGRRRVVELDAFLGARSGPGHEDFWRLDSLRESPEWDQVRDLALKALAAL